jgi:Uma2 family endonuclease
MSTAQKTLMTAEEFFAWASRPENRDKHFELVRGEVKSMPPPGERHGWLCVWIGYLLTTYALRHGGNVIGNDAGLVVEEKPDTVRGPDLMLFSETRSMEQLNPGFSRKIPQLIVEVLSPSDRAGRVQVRIEQYLARGVSLVWLVDPEDRTVTVYRPGELTQLVEEEDELTGNGVLPDFSLKVADLFRLPGSAPANESPA